MPNFENRHFPPIEKIFSNFPWLWKQEKSHKTNFQYSRALKRMAVENKCKIVSCATDISKVSCHGGYSTGFFRGEVERKKSHTTSAPSPMKGPWTYSEPWLLQCYLPVFKCEHTYTYIFFCCLSINVVVYWPSKDDGMKLMFLQRTQSSKLLAHNLMLQQTHSTTVHF